MFRSLVFSISLLTTTAIGAVTQAGDGKTLQIFVSKTEQKLVVYDGNQVVATSNVSTGKSGHTTPSGIFSILEKRKYHESNLYSNAPMPWMQRITWSGVALHESNSVPSYPASHGCVRMPGSFARQLFKMTERGAHVIITDDAVVPMPVSSAKLFQPQLPVDNNLLLSDAQLRPANFEVGSEPVEVASAEVLPKAGAAASVTIERLPPVRILITRRGMREMVKDAQQMLGELGFDAGEVDGYIGPQTIGAINGYKRWKALPTKGEIITAEFMQKLHHSSGRGEPPLGQIMVRQKFKPIFEAPVVISNPERPLGTHFAEATEVDRLSGKAEWYGVTLDDHLSTATRKRLGITQEQPSATLEAALDRITIPDNIRHRIALLLDEGSSLTINDGGIGTETGNGTDFITITHASPRG